MSKTRLLSALAATAALLGSALAAQATTMPPAAPTASSHAFTTAERNQLAAEAGISPQQAEVLSVGQLAWLKARRDSDDGAYSLGPVHVDPAQVHS